MKAVVVWVGSMLTAVAVQAAPAATPQTAAQRAVTPIVVAQADLPAPVRTAAVSANLASNSAMLPANSANVSATSDKSPSTLGILLAGLAAMMLVATRRAPR